MNVGSALILLKLAMDSGFTVSPKAEPTTPTVVYDPDISTEIKPMCAPGHYAKFNFTTSSWTCERIPGGR